MKHHTSSGKVTHIGPVALGVAVKLPKVFREVAATFGITEPDFATAKKVFGFRREKRNGVWGWRIELAIGKLTLCAPWTEGIPFPRLRKDAEAWAWHFAKAHGFEPLRRVDPPRRPKPRPKLHLVRNT